MTAPQILVLGSCELMLRLDVQMNAYEFQMENPLAL